MRRAPAGGQVDQSHAVGMVLLSFCRSTVIGSVLVVGSALVGCAVPERTDSSWTTLQVTPMTSGQIDPSALVVHAIGEQRPSAQQRLIAAGFETRAEKSLTVIRRGDEQANFERDLKRIAELFPGAVHLVVVQPDGQSCEVGDALLITPRNSDQLAALLVRHRLQMPQVILGATVRVVTQPRDDLLHLNERMAALRADPDIVQAEFDLITHPTLK